MQFVYAISDDTKTSTVVTDSEQPIKTVCYKKLSDGSEWSKRIFSPCVFARRALLLEYVLLLINMCFHQFHLLILRTLNAVSSQLLDVMFLSCILYPSLFFTVLSSSVFG